MIVDKNLLGNVAQRKKHTFISTGMSNKKDIDNANKLGFKIKLLGVAEVINNRVYQRVHPTLIKKSSYIASIDGVLNAVIVDGKPVGQNVIQGEGAGPEATTSALVSDISSILRGNIKFPFVVSYKKRNSALLILFQRH